MVSPERESAVQSSPTTCTVPLGSSVVLTTPICPTICDFLDTTVIFRAFREKNHNPARLTAIRAAVAPRTPYPTLTSGAGRPGTLASPNRRNPPSIKLTPPASPNPPQPGACNSTKNSTSPAPIRTSPIQFTGRLPSPRKASISSPTPRTPATQPPGIRISNSIRIPPNRYHYEYQCRVGRKPEELLDGRYLCPPDGRAIGFKGYEISLNGHFHAIEFVEKVRHIRCQNVQDAEFERLPVPSRKRLRFRLHQRIGISVALAGDRF